MKLKRYLWALNNQNNNFENFVFADESMIQTSRRGIYFNRKKSSHPKSSHSHPRSVKNVNIWGGISYHGPTRFVVIDFFLFEFEFYF